MYVQRSRWGNVFCCPGLDEADAQIVAPLLASNFIREMTDLDVVCVESTVQIRWWPPSPYSSTPCSVHAHVGVEFTGYMSPYSPWDGYY